jgi:hypothetical protein
VGGELNVSEWGRPVQTEGKRPPLVLNFRPEVLVHPSNEKQQEFRELLRTHLGGAVFEDEDGPYGPQGTISGSGDGWDDCDA